MWWIGLIAVILLAAVAWFEIASRNSAPSLRISEYTQLTHNGHAGWVVGTDGSRLYLTIALPYPFLVEVSPDGSTFLVQSFGEASSLPLYTVQAVGGARRYLADATIASGTWSPDRKLVAYSSPTATLTLSIATAQVPTS